MRWLKLTLSSLTLALVLCVPALAQSSPTASQYDPGSFGGCPPGSEMCVQDVGDSVDDFADSAEQGTDAVNDAMAGTASSSASPVASGEASVLPTRATSSSDADGDARAVSGGAADADTDAGMDEGLGSIEELPDTGGTPLAALIPGVLLVALGLMVRAILQP